jgi:single-strand DNA-binding protein
MNTLRNRVQLIGNLGNDPEIKELENGKKLARFSVATNDTYRNADGQKIASTQWHNIIAWDGNATIAENYLKKGREVAIEGRLAHRSYDDKDGNTKYITEVIVNQILLLSNGNKED